MTKILMPLIAAACLATALPACKKDAKTAQQDNGLSASTVAQIKAAGFNTEGAKKVPEGYLVEGDIILTEDDLGATSNSPELVFAQEEHYRTKNLVNVSQHPTIKVGLSISNSSYQAAFSAAVDEAISRYNAQNLSVRFQRVSSGADITVVGFYQVSNTLGSSGFPKGGAPYKQIQMNTYWYSTATTTTNVNYIATVMSHEMGHCIGFRHTDYMDRSYSCGGTAVDEGSAGVGAVYIPGTPTGPSANSWMLACIGDNQNRPFTSADVTALNYLY